MNAQIKELFKQSGGHTSVRNLASNPVQVVETNELWDDHIEKFVALIVEECVSQCWTVSEIEHYGSVISECSKRMRKHFGVE
jgi:hypothetical protein